MAPAYAAECYLGVCGRIANYSSVGVGIVHSWSSYPQWTQILYPGQHSTQYWRDTDGIYVGPGYCVQLRYWIPDPTGGFWNYETFPFWTSTGTVVVGYHRLNDYPYEYEIVNTYTC